MIKPIHKPLKQEALKLLTRCFVYSEKPQKFEAKIDLLTANRNCRFYGFYSKNHELLGILILEIENSVSAIIQAIACDQYHEKQGIASQLIEFGQKDTSVTNLIAETDDNSVDFYQKTGFSVENLGEKYPNVRRYRCSLAF